MSEPQKYEPGTIVWQDLTVDNAEQLSAFYEAVVGWTRDAHPMGEYSDFNMRPPAAEGASEQPVPVAGVCHALGSNSGIPPHWILYVAVDDFNGALERCRALGGDVAHGPRAMGHHRFAVIRDPAGAYLGLFSTGPVGDGE
jgi:predicted enzyme related to lactoylglutathione lyase